MNKLKRFLSLGLVLTMMCSLAPHSIFAAAAETDPASENTPVIEEVTAPAEAAEAAEAAVPAATSVTAIQDGGTYVIVINKHIAQIADNGKDLATDKVLNPNDPVPNDATQWTFTDTGDGTYTIMNNGKYLGVNGSAFMPTLVVSSTQPDYPNWKYENGKLSVKIGAQVLNLQCAKPPTGNPSYSWSLAQKPSGTDADATLYSVDGGGETPKPDPKPTTQTVTLKFVDETQNQVGTARLELNADVTHVTAEEAAQALAKANLPKGYELATPSATYEIKNGVATIPVVNKTTPPDPTPEGKGQLIVINGQMATAPESGKILTSTPYTSNAPDKAKWTFTDTGDGDGSFTITQGNLILGTNNPLSGTKELVHDKNTKPTYFKWYYDETENAYYLKINFAGKDKFYLQCKRGLNTTGNVQEYVWQLSGDPGNTDISIVDPEKPDERDVTLNFVDQNGNTVVLTTTLKLPGATKNISAAQVVDVLSKNSLPEGYKLADENAKYPIENNVATIPVVKENTKPEPPAERTVTLKFVDQTNNQEVATAKLNLATTTTTVSAEDAKKYLPAGYKLADEKEKYLIDKNNVATIPVVKVEEPKPGDNTLKDIVIDFGLPVKVAYDINEEITSANAKYGKVEPYYNMFSKTNTITYTPTGVLRGVDTVTLTGTSNKTYTFQVYPATTVYYEEGFITSSTGFTGGSKSTSTQEAPDDDKNFGRTGANMGRTSMTSKTAGDTATFSFTGTGMELYANCDTNSGMMMVLIKDSHEKIAKFYQVDTRMAKGTTDATGQQAVEASGLPVVTARDLPHGAYTVTVQHISRSQDMVGGDITLDGFRIHNTLDNLAHTAYPEKERTPAFVELRDMVLTGLSVGQGDTAQGLVDQVYTSTQNLTGAVVLGDQAVYNTSAKINDLLTNGPKNELFLYPGQAVTFKLKDGITAQIGLKAVNGNVTCNLNGNSQYTNSTDMFYPVTVDGGVTITNNNPAPPMGSLPILSITLLKYFDSSTNAVMAASAEAAPDIFEPVNEPQMARAMLSLGYEDPSALADATLNVSLTDANGQEVAAQALTASGTPGETHTFTADELRAVVDQLLPAGYGLADEAAIADTPVVYGQAGQVQIQIGLKATLTVSYVTHTLDFSGFMNGGSLYTETVVGTADFSAVQAAGETSMTVSRSDIRAAAPAGYRVLYSSNIYVDFGTQQTAKVTVR